MQPQDLKTSALQNVGPQMAPALKIIRRKKQKANARVGLPIIGPQFAPEDDERVGPDGC